MVRNKSHPNVHEKVSTHINITSYHYKPPSNRPEPELHLHLFPLHCCNLTLPVKLNHIVTEGEGEEAAGNNFHTYYKFTSESIL